MKRFKYLFIAMLAILTVSCEDEDKIALQVENLETGGFLRTIEIISGGYDFLNLDTAEFSVILEESDASDGDELESVDVFVSYRDGNGDDDLGEVFVKTIPAAEFTRGENGLPRTTLTVPAQEAISALGLSESVLVPGDQFRFRVALNLTDGQTFSADNSGDNLSGLFYSSPFRYNVTVGCPLEDDKFSGQYRVTRIEGVGPFGSYAAETMTVDIRPTTATIRSFDFSWLPDIGGFGQTLQFEFVCTDVNVIRRSTGIGCGGSIVWAQGEFDAQAFNIDDDSSFTLKFQDFVDAGGCGVPPYTVELLFEKI